MDSKRYSDQDIEAIYRVIEQRRDMRHFTSEPVDEIILERLLKAAHFAPSVGFMQPWRFIRITDSTLRKNMHELVDPRGAEVADVDEQLSLPWEFGHQIHPRGQRVLRSECTQNLIVNA